MPLKTMPFYFKNKESENVFKSISKRLDVECQHISLNSYCNNLCDRDANGNIIKIYDSDTEDIYEWEAHMYLYMMDSKLSLRTFVNKNKIVYDTHDKISLYTFLNTLKKSKTNNSVYKLILNEIFSFVCKFKQYNFIHGNLHIHNIFINPNLFFHRCKFYMLDFSNSIIIKENVVITRQIMLTKDEFNIGHNYLRCYDFFVLYKSLNYYFKEHLGNLDIVMYLEDLIERYIKKDVLLEMTSEYPVSN